MLLADQVVHIDAERLGEGRQGPGRAGASAPLDLLQVERVVLRIHANQQEPHGATADFDLVPLVNAVEAGREPWTVSLQFMFLQDIPTELMVFNPMGIITYLRGDRAMVTGR